MDKKIKENLEYINIIQHKGTDIGLITDYLDDNGDTRI